MKTSPSKKNRLGPVSAGKKSNIAVSGQSYQQSLPVAAEQTQSQLWSSEDPQGDSGMTRLGEIRGINGIAEQDSSQISL